MRHGTEERQHAAGDIRSGMPRSAVQQLRRTFGIGRYHASYHPARRSCPMPIHHTQCPLGRCVRPWDRRDPPPIPTSTLPQGPRASSSFRLGIGVACPPPCDLIFTFRDPMFCSWDHVHGITHRVLLAPEPSLPRGAGSPSGECGSRSPDAGGWVGGWVPRMAASPRGGSCFTATSSTAQQHPQQCTRLTRGVASPSPHLP